MTDGMRGWELQQVTWALVEFLFAWLGQTWGGWGGLAQPTQAPDLATRYREFLGPAVLCQWLSCFSACLVIPQPCHLWMSTAGPLLSAVTRLGPCPSAAPPGSESKGP